MITALQQPVFTEMVVW